MGKMISKESITQFRYVRDDFNKDVLHRIMEQSDSLTVTAQMDIKVMRDSKDDGIIISGVIKDKWADKRYKVATRILNTVLNIECEDIQRMRTELERSYKRLCEDIILKAEEVKERMNQIGRARLNGNSSAGTVDDAFGAEAEIKKKQMLKFKRIEGAIEDCAKLVQMRGDVEIDEAGSIIGALPKLLLIEEKTFNRCFQETKQIDDELKKIKRHMTEDTYYIINVNVGIGDTRAIAKQVYRLSLENGAIVIQTVEVGRGSALYMIEEAECVGNSFTIHEVEADEYTKYERKTLNRACRYWDAYLGAIVRAVCMYFEEADRRSEVIPNRNTASGLVEENKTAKYKDKHGIKVYDFYVSENEPKSRFIKLKSWSAYGVEKSPHARKGHERHLRDGRVIQVRSSIIHKDRYNGFESANRIVK